MSENGGDGPGAPLRGFLYVADPMCSWCWAFAPVIARIAEAYGRAAPVRLIAGGLRVGTTQPMDEAAKAYVRRHWQQVEATTGQPFDYRFFEREDFVYDTLVPCRGLVAARILAPAAALSALEAMQRAFYAHNVDITRLDVLADVVASTGIDRAAFLAAYASEEVAQALAGDFDAVQGLAIAGFPALLVADGAGAAFLTIGYRSFDALRPLIERWLGEAGAVPKQSPENAGADRRQSAAEESFSHP